VGRETHDTGQIQSDEISDEDAASLEKAGSTLYIQLPQFGWPLGDWPDILSAWESRSEDWPRGQIVASDVEDLVSPEVTIQSKSDPSLSCEGRLQVNVDAVLLSPARLPPTPGA
jgi:hypothetical protein